MKRINLKNNYTFHNDDDYIEVSDRLEAFLWTYEQKEKAYQEKTRYHKAYYSIERDEGVGNSMRYASRRDDMGEQRISQTLLWQAGRDKAHGYNETSTRPLKD